MIDPSSICHEKEELKKTSNLRWNEVGAKQAKDSEIIIGVQVKYTYRNFEYGLELREMKSPRIVKTIPNVVAFLQ